MMKRYHSLLLTLLLTALPAQAGISDWLTRGLNLEKVFALPLALLTYNYYSFKSTIVIKSPEKAQQIIAELQGLENTVAAMKQKSPELVMIQTIDINQLAHLKKFEADGNTLLACYGPLKGKIVHLNKLAEINKKAPDLRSTPYNRKTEVEFSERSGNYCIKLNSIAVNAKKIRKRFTQALKKDFSANANFDARVVGLASLTLATLGTYSFWYFKRWMRE